MAKKKRRKKKGKGGIIAVLIAGVVGAGYFMRDCLPNWGMGGGGSGSSSESAENNETTETQPPGQKGIVAVTVKGDVCSHEGTEAPCADVCETIKTGKVAAETTVEIDTTAGTTGASEALVECLETAGFSVQVKSE